MGTVSPKFFVNMVDLRFLRRLNQRSGLMFQNNFRNKIYLLAETDAGVECMLA